MRGNSFVDELIAMLITDTIPDLPKSQDGFFCCGVVAYNQTFTCVSFIISVKVHYDTDVFPYR